MPGRIPESGRLQRRLRSLAASASRRQARRKAAERIHQDLEALTARPLISLVMPTFRTDLRYLREAVDSVRAQHYPDWELIIVDDGSEQPALAKAIEAHAAADPRIRFLPQAENGGISAASNAGLALCTGELVGFLDHDDVLTPDALLRVAQAFAADPELDVVYSDQDKLTLHGRRADPFLKPSWSPVYALGAMYIGHLLVLRRAVAEAAGGFDPAFDKIQDFEFMLRVCERTDRIGHIPQILYHWRAIPGSIAAGAEEKTGVPELQAKAVSAHLERIGAPALALPHPRIPHRAILAPRNGSGGGERASVVIPALAHGGGPARLLDSIFALTRHADLEVLVVAPSGSSTDLGQHPVVRIAVEPGTTRAAANNAGAAQATGSLLVFLDEDCEVAEPDWIEQLDLHVRLPRVGAVGPLLVRPDGRVDQAGMAIGLSAPAVSMMNGFDADGDGYYGSLPCAHEVSALSSLCLAVPAPLFEQVGGFNEFYRSQYEDADLCRRLAQRGLEAVFTPRPRVITHQTGATRRAATDIVDRALFVDNWYDELVRGDRYFNPGFSRRAADYAPAGWRDRAQRQTRVSR